MRKEKGTGVLPSRDQAGALLSLECRGMSRFLLLASIGLCLGTAFVPEHANEWVVRIDEGE